MEREEERELPQLGGERARGSSRCVGSRGGPGRRVRVRGWGWRTAVERDSALRVLQVWAASHTQVPRLSRSPPLATPNKPRPPWPPPPPRRCVTDRLGAPSPPPGRGVGPLRGCAARWGALPVPPGVANPFLAPRGGATARPGLARAPPAPLGPGPAWPRPGRVGGVVVRAGGCLCAACAPRWRAPIHARVPPLSTPVLSPLSFPSQQIKLMSADSEVFEIEEKVGRMSQMITNMLDGEWRERREGRGGGRGRGGRRERHWARLSPSLLPFPIYTTDTETGDDTVPLPNVSGPILTKVKKRREGARGVVLSPPPFPITSCHHFAPSPPPLR